MTTSWREQGLRLFWQWLEKWCEDSATCEVCEVTWPPDPPRRLRYRRIPRLTLPVYPAPRYDIGAFYERKFPTPDGKKPLAPHDEPHSNFLQFDLDANDMPGRFCCDPEQTMRSLNICTQCWTLLVWQTQVIMQILATHFGITDAPLITFTGGRGVHLRYYKSLDVCRMPKEARAALVAAIEMYDGPLGQDTWPAVVAAMGWIGELSALRHQYGRLKPDKPVTIQLGHLLRSPYSWHQRTKLICYAVPNIAALAAVDPNTLPTPAQRDASAACLLDPNSDSMS